MGLLVNANIGRLLLTQRCTDRAVAAARSCSQDDLLAQPVDDIAREIVANVVPQPIELDLSARTVSAGDITVRGRTTLFTQRPNVDATVIRVHIPYTGEPSLFTYSPSQLGPRPQVEHADNEVVITIMGSDPDLPDIRDAILQQQAMLVNWVDAVNRDIDQINDRVRERVVSILTSRRARLKQANHLVDALDIPVKHLHVVDIPTEPEPLALVTETGPTGQPEWRLTNDTYEQVLDTIIRFGHALERRPASALALIPNEETLRDWIVFLLNTNFRSHNGNDVFVVGEATNGSGKTDILVRQDDVNAFIGECKVWHGPAAFRKAIDQLLGYTVWRDTKAALIVFIMSQGVSEIVAKADATIRAHTRFVEAADQESDERRDYVLSSPSDSQRLISLALIPFVVPKN